MKPHPLQGKLSTAIIALVCALAALNLWLGPGIIQTHAGGDSPFLLQRVYEMAVSLRAGAFPVRWMPDAAYGLGYPFFNFYAASAYYLAAGLNLAGFDLLTAIKLTQTLGMFAAAASMWLYARSMLPGRGALLAAVAYTLAPYHLVNLYVRGDSLQEFFAFIWYPLILWAVDGVVSAHTDATGERKSLPVTSRVGYMLLLAVALAGLVVTHNVSALIFIPFIVLYSLARLLQLLRNSAVKHVATVSAQLGGAALLALFLSAWFWMPALGESGLVQLTNQTSGYFNYNNHFRLANLVQTNLLFDYRVDNALNAFAMALPQLLLAILGAVTWLRWGARRVGAALMLGLFLVATVMVTPLSKPIWDAVPALALTQFPWRFLSIQSLFTAMLIGGVGYKFVRNHNAEPATLRTEAPVLVGMALLVALLALSLPGLPNERLDIRSEDVTPRTLQEYEWLSGNIGTTIRAEYLPHTTQPRPVVGPDLLQQHDLVSAVSGRISDSTLEKDSPALRVWRITVASDTATITLPLLYWAAWQADAYTIQGDQVAGAGIPVTLSPYAGSGWMQLNLPRGVYRLELRLTGTPLERLAEVVSLVGVLIMAVCVVMIFLQTAHSRRLAIRVLGATALVLFAIWFAGQVMRATYQPTAPVLQTVDYGERQFVHRSTVLYRSESDATYELTGVTLNPANVRAGETFTLTTTWRDNRAPAQIGVVQELPSGGYFARLFYFARSTSYGAPAQSQHIVITDALPGPLLLKLLVIDAAGNAYTPTSSSGQVLDHSLLTGLTVTAPATVQNIDKPPMRVFPNGIRLRYADWYQPTENDVCFRATWDRTLSIADALQIAYVLKGSNGQLIARADIQPQAGLAPTWSWPTGAPVSDGYCVPMTAKLLPGERYTMMMRLYRLADQHATGEVTLVGNREQMTTLAPNRPQPVITVHQYERPSAQHAVDVTFGDSIKLVGYDLITTTNAMQVTLYWTSPVTITQDFKMFVHLATTSSPEPVRQTDRLTRDGMYPTGMWAPGEIVSDTVTLDTSNLPAATYQLAVGWYDPETLVRLAAISSTQAITDGRYVLSQFSR